VSEGITFKLAPAAAQIVASLKTWPVRMVAAIVRTMYRQNQLTIAHISKVRMRGNDGKPFPPALGKLGIRSAHLVRSLRASRPRGFGTVIVSNIGSNVRYAGVHEFGATINRVQKAGSIRLRTDARGNRLRQASNPNLFVFAGKKHKRAETVPFAGGKRFTIRIPARAPITHGIEDRVPDYEQAISAAIENTKPV
jgi:phage gpG-like protein